ncbi:MAG TPA: ROK family protein [Candidatus Limnocylindrales bacterium]|nr:ROK family protein [Candidatus Limnocylindrales bacterium]
MTEPAAGPTGPEARSLEDGAVLALDLGASRTRAAVVDADGRIVTRTDGRTPREAGPDGVIAASVGMLRRVRDAAPAAIRERIVGVGISAPGPLDRSTGTLIEPPNLGPTFHDVRLAEPIGRALALPAVLERDTNVAALAEWRFGVARGAGDFLYLTVSTGIGGGIVAGGRLLTGADGVAGELGHLLVELDGPPCGCGGRGHLEAIASGTGIARAAAAAIAGGSAPGLAALARELGRGLDARDVALAEEEGDATAAAILDRARVAFAEACVALVDVFNPELIVVGGSIARNQGDRWLGPARERVARTSFRIPRERVAIVPAALGDDVGLVGAVAIVGVSSVA